MIQIFIAFGIVGAFYYLIEHILNKGKKDGTVRTTVEGATRFVLKVLVPFLIFMMAVYIFLRVTHTL